MHLRIPDLIIKKRNGHELSKEEIDFFIKSICESNNNSVIQESQLGAMLMAIFFRGLNFNESYYITHSMMKSGACFDFQKHRNLVVDKHSTGGVGDKISLPLAPALAACGLKVPMISGRGLGFTGGTLDKLESIPGFQVSCTKEKIESLIDEVGCCIVGQTLELNPADRILYATRDITGTVDCIPLIAGSIVSKKAIEDLDALVLDVKVGRAAFMQNQEEAEKLADYMIQISRKLGLKAGVFLTRHDNPLGKAVGNQIEIIETIECLHGNVRHDLEELITKYGGYLLQRVDKCETMVQGAKIILEKLKNGEALEKFRQMLIGQGVSEKIANDLCNRNYDAVFKQKAKYLSTIRAQTNGYIKSIHALELGLLSSKLGAGRAKAGDEIFYEVGMNILKQVGDKIDLNEPWIEVHHNSEHFDTHFAQKLMNSIEIVDYPVQFESSIIKIIDYA
ncbi:unnamed protein product [Brachionus calyciflorus]|uniref:Thymidine phosphorylase n=1 Tax=Brachionus calyciflorus TaxID=104777 RepID=A0A813XY24_9BILA|nr:unnamed protein product [Brachionus calyciflorus]